MLRIFWVVATVFVALAILSLWLPFKVSALLAGLVALFVHCLERTRLVPCLVALALLAPTVRAEEIYPNQRSIAILRKYNLNATTETWCASYGKPGAETGGASNGDDYTGAKLIKTSGSSTTTVSRDTNANAGAFANVHQGDIIATLDSAGRRIERVVTEKASDDSITVDDAWELSPAGVPFRFRNVLCDTTGDAGAIFVGDLTNLQFSIQVRQLSVDAGGVTVHVRCQQAYGTDFEDITRPAVITTAGDCYDCGLKRMFQISETFYACRVGLKLEDDDATDTGADAEQIEVFMSGKPVSKGK